MRIRFGTDGWRGVIAREFTFENLSIVAQATMDWMREEGLAERGLVIGYDRRFLSRQFAERVAEVAAGNGIEVSLADRPCPTPAVSWQVKHAGKGAGVMITASHNPAAYNGFKLKEAFGGSARPSTTALLERKVASNIASGRPVLDVLYATGVVSGKILEFDPRPDYLEQLASCVDIPLIQRSGLKVAIDPMYGAGAGWLSRLLPEAVELHAEENPSFGGRSPEPTEENLQELGLMVKKGGYAIGLAFDGDADRIGAVDESGEYFSSHHIFAVALRHLYGQKGLRGGVVKGVSTTRMIDLLCERYGLPLFETPIGFKHICELMLENDILIGGEESGGLGVRRHMAERDGILMGLILLEAMAASGKGLRGLLEEAEAETGRFFYRRIDLPVPPGARERLAENLSPDVREEEIAGKRVAAKNFRDGFKFIFEDGSWLLIRASGTEPVLRLYAEALSDVEVDGLLAAGRLLAGA